MSSFAEEMVTALLDAVRTSGRMLCAVMIAPDAERKKVKLVICTDDSDMASVEYSKGPWLDLDAATARLKPEQQHRVLRTLAREAAQRFPISKGARAVPWSLLLHPNDTDRETVSVSFGDDKPILAVTTGLNTKTYVLETVIWRDEDILVVGLEAEAFGAVQARFAWSALETAKTDPVELRDDKHHGLWAPNSRSGADQTEVAKRLCAEKLATRTRPASPADLKSLVAKYRKDLDIFDAQEIADRHGSDVLRPLLVGLAKNSKDDKLFGRACSHAMDVLAADGELDEAFAVSTLPGKAARGWVELESALLLLRLGRNKEAAQIAAKKNDEHWLVIRAVAAFLDGQTKTARPIAATLKQTPRSPYAALADAFDPAHSINERGALLDRVRQLGFTNRRAVSDELLKVAELEPELAPLVAAVRERDAQTTAAHVALNAAFEAAEPIFGDNTKLEDESGGKRSIWKDSHDDDDDEVTSISHRYRFDGEWPVTLQKGSHPTALAAGAGLVVLASSDGRLHACTVSAKAPKLAWAVKNVPARSLTFADDTLLAACPTLGLVVISSSGEKLTTHEPQSADGPELVAVSGTRVAAVGKDCIELFEGAPTALKRRGSIYSDDAMRGAAFVGNVLAVTHQSLGGVALYDVSNLDQPKLLRAVRLKANTDCRFIYALDTRVLVRCDEVLWLLDIAKGKPKHLSTLPMRFNFMEAWPAIHVGKHELVLADIAPRRAASVLSIKGNKLQWVDVLPFEASINFQATAFAGEEIWGVEGDATKYRLLRLLPSD